MSCPDDVTLQRYLERRLEARRRPEIDGHLDACPTCRETVAALARTSLVPPAEADEEFVDASDEPVSIGRYVLGEQIGIGGMGVVHRAEDPELGRTVAIKRVRAGASQGEGRRARMIREARSLAALSHPNIVPIYDVGEYDGGVFLVMEHVEGVNLGRWLQNRAGAQTEVLRVLLEAGRGLAAAHDAGFVHRDFKPDNVMVADDGRVMVTDFGLVTMPSGDDAAGSGLGVATEAGSGAGHRLTAEGGLLGTPAYMSPEQLIGEAVGPAADQFAFCVTAFEAFGGERPFPSAPAVRLAAIRDAVLPGTRRAVPRRLRGAIERGLLFEPTARHASIHDLLGLMARASPRRWRTAGLVACAAALPVAVAAVIGAVSADTQPAEVNTPPEDLAKLAAVRADIERAQQHADRGEFIEAIEISELAHQDALALGAWDAAADAATRLVTLKGYELQDHEDGERWSRHAESALQRWGEDPIREAKLLASVGQLLFSRGDYAEATRVWHDVVQRQRRLHGPESSELASALTNLGVVLTSQGELDEAIEIHQRALTTIGGRPEPRLRARILIHLAGAQVDQGDVSAGRETLEAAIAEVDDGARRNGRLLGRATNNLAFVLLDLGDFDAAEAAIERARALLEPSFGPDHPNVAIVLVQRATLHMYRQEYEQGRDLLLRCLATMERTFGADHPSLVATLNNLGVAARMQGDVASARRHLERALAIEESKVGPDDLSLASGLEELGNLLSSSDLDAAEAALVRAHDIRVRHVGEDDPSLCLNWVARAKISLATERFDESEAALERALSLAQDPERRAVVLITQGELLWTQGRRSRAVQKVHRAQAELGDDPRYAALRANAQSWMDSRPNAKP